MSVVSLCGQCTLACDQSVNVSLAQDGQATITPETVAQNPYNPATCSPTGPQHFEVTVMLPGGQTVATNPVVTCAQLDATLTVKVKHLPSGNSCWGNITVQDYLPPTLNCPDLTVSCNTADLAPSNPLIGYPTISDNCDANVTRSFSDVFTDVTCGQTVNGLPVAAYVTRQWAATDDKGNTATCLQHIWLLRRTVADIVFPPNRDNIAAPALSCVNANTAPASTGLPTIDGRAIDGFCELSFTFQDQNLPMCGTSHKILRTWTALDWCSSQIRTHLQVIAIEDKTPPAFACPADMTLSTSAADCFADVNFPAVQATDDCSGPASLQINTPFGLINGNGGQLSNFPIGSHTVTYVATDGCGNARTCSLALTVADQIAPLLICDAALIVSLNNLGTGVAMAKSFDDGSYDNCCPASALGFAVRRMQDSIFAPKVTFTCADVGTPQMVVLRVSDCDGNADECMVSVEVQDKSKPSIVCPANVTVNCDVFSINDLTAYGSATATDNCDTPTLVELAPNAQNLGDCGAGYVVRNFRATDSAGRTAHCTQRVTVQNPTPWNGAQRIAWPTDFTSNQCATSAASLAPDSLPPGKNFPTWTGGNGCNQIAYNFDDQLFQIAPPACFKIFRRWKVVDWCQYNPNNPTGPGQWTHTQTITVMDNTPPVFTTPPADITVGTDATCKATVNLPVPTTSDCADNVTVTASSPLGTGFGPFQNVQSGVYPITFRATDGCGNVSVQHVNLVVKDQKPPSVICLNGLSVSVMQSGMVSIWARDFNAGSYDNCSAGNLQFSFSQNPADTGRIFSCQNLGTNVVDVWATDAAGNQAFCATYVIVQDNLGACVPPSATVAGAVKTFQNQKLSGVTLKISGVAGLPDLVTDTSGSFAFPGLPVNAAFTLTPRKTNDVLNGVSTFDLLLISKHILGIQPLNSPYKIIAADANRSGSVSTFDVVTLRKLILGLTDTLPGGASWRFVDSDWQFSDPQNPFVQTFPESKYFDHLPAGGGLANFTALKIGDLNGNATPNFGDAGDERNEADPLILKIDNQSFKSGETVAVPIRATDWGALEGYQFSLPFDPGVLRLDSAGAFHLNNLTMAHFGLRHAPQGWLTANWENPQGAVFSVEKPLFTLFFTALRSGQLSDFLANENANAGENWAGHADEEFPKHWKSGSSEPEPLRSEAYRAGQIAPLFFEFSDKSTPAFPAPELRQNRPNPFSDDTRISFFVPEIGDADLRIFDAAGRLVFARRFEQISGEQSLSLRASDLPGKGIFYCQLEVGGKTLRRKMILI